MWKLFVLKLTHRLWNRQISRILCRAYEDRVIDSKQMHELTAAFDPTQEHQVYGSRAQCGFRHRSVTVDDVLDEQLRDGEVAWTDEKRAAMRMLRS